MYETIQRDGIERQGNNIHFPAYRVHQHFEVRRSLQRKKEMGPNGDKIKQEGMGAQHLGEQICFPKKSRMVLLSTLI